MTSRNDLLGMPFVEMCQYLDEVGVGRRHASRVFRGLHREGRTLAEIPNLGRHAATIAQTSSQCAVTLGAVHRSEDGTEKMVVTLAKGEKVEAVLIPMSEGRYTVCVSSQVGCAMGCVFCATGTLGLTRGLKAGEIVAQVHAARRLAEERGRRLTRVVFMGMGEPLHHYKETSAALRVLLDDHGLCFGSKNITVSTVGLVGRMRQFQEDFGGRVQLALSLHAGTNETRRRIVPAAMGADLARLRHVLLTHPLPGSRKIMVEYVVLPGVNDSEEEVEGLIAWMEGIPGIVNLIPFNPFAGAQFRSPTSEEVWSVHHRLRAAGVASMIRWPRGRQAHGACGQLALAHEKQASASA